jgi:uncharacterized membrane protein
MQWPPMDMHLEATVTNLPPNQHRRRTTAAGILLGVGLGGFVDGILLHQILQWHNMLSGWVPPVSMETMKLNMVWDGIFHAFVWSVTLAGVMLLHAAAARHEPIPTLRVFIGQLVFGWGLFNLVEGMINHQILGIHHVREVENHLFYDLTFLAVGGVLLIVVGWLLMRRDARAA